MSPYTRQESVNCDYGAAEEVYGIRIISLGDPAQSAGRTARFRFGLGFRLRRRPQLVELADAVLDVLPLHPEHRHVGPDVVIRPGFVAEFAVEDAPNEERKTALGREIDELVRRREREARESRVQQAPAQFGAQELAYV